jgi:glyoxylase-like metal-dependent hydrolase (beta-lactamase superfamily II)
MSVEVHCIPLGFDNCYVLVGDGAVVLDAGQPRKGRTFSKRIQQVSIQPADVNLILLTHAHWDHMGSAAEIKSITGAPLAVHEREADWVESGNPPLPPGLTTWGRTFTALHRLAMPFIDVPSATVDMRLGDESMSLDHYGVPGTVVHTPGHSPGSVSVVLENGDAFVGDLAMNRLPLRASPGLPIFGDSMEQIIWSWKTLLAMGVENVFPAHGKPFSADIIRESVAV